MKSIRSFFPTIVIGSLVFVHPASASIAYIGSTTGTNGAGDTLKALVVMTVSGQSDGFGHTCSGGTGILCMTLENIQTGGTQTITDLLGAVYFSVTGNPTLTPVSAVADSVLRPTSTNTPVLSTAPQGSPLAGGWALVAPPGTDTLNASLPKTGYAWATDPNSGAVAGSYNVGSVDNYEIMSGSNVSLISGTNAIISNELFLTLSGFQSGGSTLALSTISGVVFSWDLNGQFSANGTLTPEPGTTGVVAMALMGLLAGRKALRRRNAAK